MIILNMGFREVISEEVAFVSRSELDERLNHAKTSWKNIPGRGTARRQETLEELEEEAE